MPRKSIQTFCGGSQEQKVQHTFQFFIVKTENHMIMHYYELSKAKHPKMDILALVTTWQNVKKSILRSRNCIVSHYIQCSNYKYSQTSLVHLVLYDKNCSQMTTKIVVGR